MSQVNVSEPRPATTSSQVSNSTQEDDRTVENTVTKEGKVDGNIPAGGEGESAIPEDKKEDLIEQQEDDWEHDKRNPRNWTFGKKWTAVAIVSLYTVVPPLASSMMAPALPDIAEHFGITSPTLSALTLSVFLITFAIGPLFMAPLSEIYGRTWILHICNILSLAFNLSCGFVPTVGGLIGLRILSGLAGSAPIAIGGGTVSDCFSARERANAMAVYSMGPLLGPALGPIAGGYIAQTVGYKYIFVVIGGLSAISAAIGIPLLEETYGPVIRLRIAKKSVDPEKAAASHPHLVADHGNKWHVIWVNLERPTILLTRSLVCFLLSFYMAIQYGIYYLMFSTFPTLFADTYGFGPGPSGLAYIGLGLGFLSATAFGGNIGTKIYVALANRNGGKGTPEMRLPAFMIGSLFVPVGLFWYGWSAQARIHWIMPIIGTGLYGFGMMGTYLPIQLYLVDSFQYAASALGAAAVFRSLLGFAFPLFGEQMFHALGYGGGNSLLAGVAIALGIPFPVWLYFNGARMRANSKYTR